MKNSRLRCARAALVLFVLLSPPPATAGPELCEAAAHRAAAESGVPADVLLAIALTETGRLLEGVTRPWPWAANLDGRSHWFDTAREALDFAQDALAEGRDSIDLGCFQINWRWHGMHFSSPRALLDPLEGARYAARFLTDLAGEFGSWEAAAGAYHSRSPHLAARYRARFERLRAGLALRSQPPHRPAHPADPALTHATGDPPQPAPPRVNTFPLLIVTPERPPQPSLVPDRLAGGPAFLPALQGPRP